MKKYIVLAILFIFPLVVYLFFASGVNQFAKLPVLTQNVEEIGAYSDVQFKDRITVLGFFGGVLQDKKALALNLNQKIYKRFYQFLDFQFVIALPEGAEEQAESLRAELEGTTGTDMSRWNFVFLAPDALERVFRSLNLPLALDNNSANPFVFIIDRDANLRGRDEDDFFGYDARSVADINTNMVDDVKVILAEYSVALYMYNQGRKP